MFFELEGDLRAVSTDAIYHEGVEDGPCGRLKEPSHRVRQIEMDCCCVCQSDSVAGGGRVSPFVDSTRMDDGYGLRQNL